MSLDLSKPLRVKLPSGDYRLAEQRGELRHGHKMFPHIVVHWDNCDFCYLLRDDALFTVEGTASANSGYRLENVPPEPRKRTRFIGVGAGSTGLLGNGCYNSADDAESESKRIFESEYLGVQEIEIDESKLIRRPL